MTTSAEAAAVLGNSVYVDGKYEVLCPRCTMSTFIADYEGAFTVLGGGDCQCGLYGVREAIGEVVARDAAVKVEAGLKYQRVAGNANGAGQLARGSDDDELLDSLYDKLMNESDEQPEPLVSGVVPSEVVGVISGSGGAGKGIILQTLCTCVASKKPVPFLGYEVKQHGMAIFWTAEDRRRQLLYRQRKINMTLGLEPDDMKDRLVLKAHRQPKCILWVEGKPTKLLLTILADTEQLGGKLLTIDSASICYGDDEIRRLQVGQFLRYLDLWAEKLGCTIIVVLHTSRSSDDSVERLASGSTAWVFQARFALGLLKDAADALSLNVAKDNYSKPGLKIDLHWNDHGVLARKVESATLKGIVEHADDKIILDEITKAYAAGDPLNMSNNSPRYLPTVMARLGRMNQKRANASMLRLRDLGRVGPISKGKLHGIKPL